MGLAIKQRALESVSIGPDIRVDILHIGENEVSLNITAPPELKILRSQKIIRPERPRRDSFQAYPGKD